MRKKYERVLALHLHRRGLAFCLFDAPGSLHDWGIKHVPYHRKAEGTLALAKLLIEQHSPDVQVIEDTSAIGARRPRHVCALYQEIETFAEGQGVSAYAYPWQAVFTAFAARQPQSRHDIAVHVARLLPMIRKRLPPRRKPWLPQDPRQSLFDAAALAITYYTANP